MRLLDLQFPDRMRELTEDQRLFAAKMVVKEVQRIAKREHMDEESAYWALMHGLYGGDREIT